MEQRISLITLGVADHAVSRAFYERLGWRCTLDLGGPIFFQAGGLALGLWARDELAADSGVVDTTGWGGVTLAQNVRSEAEVDRVIAEARAAGARIVREPAKTAWGGYSGVFVDPDGHPWEAAYNPGFQLLEDGSMVVPHAE